MCGSASVRDRSLIMAYEAKLEGAEIFGVLGWGEPKFLQHVDGGGTQIFGVRVGVRVGGNKKI